MLLGYNQATGMGCSTLEQDLILCERAGFDVLEIRLDMLRNYLRVNTPKSLAGFFAESRMRPGALNAVYIYPEFLTAVDEPARGHALLDEFIMACSLGRRIGADGLVVVPPLNRGQGEGPFLASWSETKSNCVRILGRLSEIASDYSMNIYFEPVGLDRSGVRTIAQAKEIVDGVDACNLGYALDSYNIFLDGGSNDYSGITELFDKKPMVVHLADADDVPGADRGQDKRRFVESGGAVDIESFLRTLQAIDYAGSVSVEIFRPEYWAKNPEWVISEAYRTSRSALMRSGAL